MQPLLDLQRRIARAVLAGDPLPAAPALHDDAPGAAARLGIYHNHFRVTLIDALATTFPVVGSLVGEGCFRHAARSYVLTTPPAQPCLHRYGAAFPRHLAGLPALSGLPYLADVARLEWALHDASIADDPEPAARSDRPGGGGRIGLHPSCRLVCSPYPVDRIWKMHQDDEQAGSVDLDAGGVRLLVHRRGDDVGWLHLPPPAAAFVGVLLCEGVVRKAAALARALDLGFDPAALLAALIEADLVAMPAQPSH
jgi:hypothetical protein